VDFSKDGNEAGSGGSGSRGVKGWTGSGKGGLDPEGEASKGV